jgi:hypothetical protein
MPNPAQDPAVPEPKPVHSGTVISNVMVELQMLCGELDALRNLRDDLGAWFSAHPEESERFGEFQHEQMKVRRSARDDARKKSGRVARSMRRSR